MPMQYREAVHEDRPCVTYAKRMPNEHPKASEWKFESVECTKKYTDVGTC